MKVSVGNLAYQVQSLASMVCHVEAEGSNIPWNQPAIIDFSEAAPALKALRLKSKLQDDPEAMPGQEPEIEVPAYLGIYADDSKGDSVSVYICQGASKTSMSLVQAFTVEGSKKITKGGKTVNASKGSVTIAAGDAAYFTFKGVLGFDANFTKAELASLKFHTRFAAPGMTYVQSSEIASHDNGTDFVGVSEAGKSEGEGYSFDYTHIGAGLFDAVNGSIYYSYEGGDGQPFSTRACVDADNYLVDCSAAKFAAGGALDLNKDLIPGVLPITFDPKSPTGFDCATADWSTTVTVSTDEAVLAKHEACDAGSDEVDLGSDYSSCFGEGFGTSDELVTIEETTEDGSSVDPDVTAEGDVFSHRKNSFSVFP